MKYLIVGLGNPGEEYSNTRHNIGFKALDALASASNVVFSPGRYADTAEIKHKGRTLILVKPMTFMNLSGKAVNYWMQKEKIPVERILVITDDLALPFGKIRIRAKGSDGGHNGLKNIQEILGINAYPRMRFGVGDDFSKGQQVNYVLAEWSEEERGTLQERLKKVSEAVLSFPAIGLERTMNFFNNS
ncbi:MAG: aminoacyl-tRNA hydrolase [Flavobacteriales bacterium]|jgi:PTH1 family peptidyl-tRNA hydrolase|nr:aminoacyl-tRNA hydrolase [Flavobacteriales bacterium]NCG28916.1 aminoacyl-tRNA hydrolase [Bacteroidota bacterium]MBT3964008.1 aminoacyl-tRNA hydrolase [Flavobacteriales bacterium]MBT4703885.1 aminoacyl-tRNA hydrolase [Flavobacteriales bacterium]MBT4931060.1 aminoacyl-tRNA hydrolase [Flavobacteriales bacterium]